MFERKLMLAALLVTSAFGALPTLAVADPEIELNENTSFTVSGGAASLGTSGFEVNCASVTGSGEFADSQSGTVVLALHGCKGPLSVNCTTSGQSSGTIKTTELPFRVKSATEGKLAVLITSNAGHFATFQCSFLASVVVSGNGLIGIVTSPGFEEESSTLALEFSGEGGVPAHTTVDGEETEYGLQASINGGAGASASLSGAGEVEFAGAVQIPGTKELGIVVVLSETGTVKSKNTFGIHCDIGCKNLFRTGKKVELEVVPAAKLKFKEWKLVNGNAGTCTAAKTPCELTLNNDAALIAIFE